VDDEMEIFGQPPQRRRRGVAPTTYISDMGPDGDANDASPRGGLQFQ
jgi:hypothetical protein